jgi:hypothetical protein
VADIVNPEAIRFVNEEIRPLCEAARSLAARIDSMKDRWDAGISDIFANNEDVLIDGRADKGVSVLTSLNIKQAGAGLLAMRAAIDDAQISKPCVRPINVD